MTRINLIDPKKLADQHLLAEYRELPRIFGAVKKKLEQWKKIKVGKQYKMWTWHVIFFYDKLLFLQKRFEKLAKECQKRGFNIKFSGYDISDFPLEYKKDFNPTKQDIEISIKRIQEKIISKPNFYKFYWKKITD